jgi:hypothetical protein
VERRERRVVVPDDGVLLAGRYLLQDRIAVGGMGEVWRAADTVLGRAVAVKLLRPEYAGDGELLARFRAEARYAALVCHPGVVPVYDYGQGGPVGAPFLVMELVDGPSLADVAAYGPLEPTWVLDVAGQVAGVASGAHSASPAPAASGVPAARMVMVDEAVLAGQPAGPVLRQLRRVGLRPRVVWVPDGHLAAGTVISVRPAGQVLAGGTVTVTAAMAPPGHRRGRGDGEGDGNDG